MSAGADVHCSAYCHAWRDMRVSINDAVMVDSSPGVNNDIRAQLTPCLHDSPGQNLDAVRDLEFRRYDR
jgi:hypothetical protein